MTDKNLQQQDLIARLRKIAGGNLGAHTLQEAELRKEAADALEAQAQEIERLRAENKISLDFSKISGRVIHNMTVGKQAAWIEWKHGGGAESAMEWIENGLEGPGLIPEDDEPHATNAQAYFDANVSYGETK